MRSRLCNWISCDKAGDESRADEGEFGELHCIL